MTGKPSHGPFGRTGICTERYTRWEGKLASRKKIVLNTVIESVRHNIKHPAVIVLIVLAWIFSVLLSVLMAAGGGVSLEMDPDAAANFGPIQMGVTGQERQGLDISLHQSLVILLKSI